MTRPFHAHGARQVTERFDAHVDDAVARRLIRRALPALHFRVGGHVAEILIERRRIAAIDLLAHVDRLVVGLHDHRRIRHGLVADGVDVHVRLVRQVQQVVVQQLVVGGDAVIAVARDPRLGIDPVHVGDRARDWPCPASPIQIHASV